MDKVRLDFKEWMPRIVEKITFIQLKEQDHVDLTENEYSLLKVLYRVWYDDLYPLLKNETDIIDEPAEQQGLFLSQSPTNG